MDNADAILKVCGDIDRLESDADFVFACIGELFREVDAKQIPAEGGYQLLESIIDRAEDVANVIEGTCWRTRERGAGKARPEGRAPSDRGRPSSGATGNAERTEAESA
jgi:hypothetical protein